jgi:hypothetical protein
LDSDADWYQDMRAANAKLEPGLSSKALQGIATGQLCAGGAARLRTAWRWWESESGFKMEIAG